MKLLKIGRDMSNDIVLQSNRVSSLHAEITLLDNGDIQLEDKGSSNGTFVMNQPIKPGKVVNIRRGDAIRFADVELQWSQVPMPEDNSAFKGIYGIGSNFNNDIQISGATVSRYHATVKQSKDGKMYIVDHSKNGTTVDGVKIPKDSLYRIKKSSAVVCGGVPVDLSRLPWPSGAGKTILGIAAAVLVLVGITFGIMKLINNGKTYTDEELYAKYSNSIVLLEPIYHYEVSVGDLNLTSYNANCDVISRMTGGRLKLHIPPQVIMKDGEWVMASGYESQDLIALKNKSGNGYGTGFFISEDGKLITNLHVVKFWLFDGSEEELESAFTKNMAQYVDFMQNYNLATSNINEVLLNPSTLPAYLSQVKVKGVLDYIALTPNGQIYDADNITKCQIVSAGTDINKDVALIQTINKQLPTKDCTYVDINNLLDTSEESLGVGKHVYTLGFPTGLNWSSLLQKSKSTTGIEVIGQGGNITQKSSEFSFGHNAAATGGASGSPIFNERGMLIGVLSESLSKVETQGYNYGIKAKYVKELIEGPAMH